MKRKKKVWAILYIHTEITPIIRTLVHYKIITTVKLFNIWELARDEDFI